MKRLRAERTATPLPFLDRVWFKTITSPDGEENAMPFVTLRGHWCCTTERADRCTHLNEAGELLTGHRAFDFDIQVETIDIVQHLSEHVMLIWIAGRDRSFCSLIERAPTLEEIEPMKGSA